MPAPKLHVIHPRRRMKSKLRGWRYSLGLVPYLKSSHYPNTWVQERNAFIFARRLMLGMVVVAVLIALSVAWANACEPVVRRGPLVLMEPTVRDAYGEVPIPRRRRNIEVVTLPAQVYDAYFDGQRGRPVLYELRINGRLWVRVRARRGEPLVVR